MVDPEQHATRWPRIAPWRPFLEFPTAPKPPRRILVVEDVLLIRLIYEQVLAELQATDVPDLSVEFAADGHQALERLSRAPSIDVLLIDLYIPGPSGFEIIEHAREHSHCRDTRIAVISARDSGDRELAQTLGIDAFLHKPVSSDLLKSTVMRLLGDR